MGVGVRRTYSGFKIGLKHAWLHQAWVQPNKWLGHRLQTIWSIIKVKLIQAFELKKSMYNTCTLVHIEVTKDEIVIFHQTFFRIQDSFFYDKDNLY